MSRQRIVRISIFIGLAIAIVFIIGWRLLDHDLEHRQSEPFSFSVNGKNMQGTLWLPSDETRAAIVLVHGDGSQNRTSSGGYAPLVNALLDRGIAVASWDKAGVGKSEGNWLSQSMEDRALETKIALKKRSNKLGDGPVGALGFSQAGWVLPQLTSNDTDFVVLVGAAVSWEEQREYYARIRLAREGMTDAEIDLALIKIAQQDSRLFANDAKFDPAQAYDGLSEDRWNFIRINRSANSLDQLSRLDMPVLAVWGADDLNVNPQRNAAVYEQRLSTSTRPYQIRIIPKATHGLLKSGPYNTQLSSQWSWIAAMRFVLEGRYAYAPGTIDDISLWILSQVPAPVSD